MEKRKSKNDGGILSASVKASIKSAACAFITLLISSFVALKAEDPAKHFFVCALICCGVGGAACAVFSFSALKEDVLPCSLISAAILCAVIAVGSLFYDAADDIVHRIAPCAVLLTTALLFALLLKGASGKKRRRIR